MATYTPPLYMRQDASGGDTPPPAPGKNTTANHGPQPASYSYASYAQSGPDQPQRNDSYEMPQFTATFVPGGYDDYYMPEVIAPSPQRVMPEVPQNMQEDLQRMELEAREIGHGRGSNPTTTTTSPTSPHFDRRGQTREPSLSTVLSSRAGGGAGPAQGEFQPFKDTNSTYQNMAAAGEMPSFSPFPKIKGDNVPPSDDEKEEILYNARQHVLHSNNVPMQLSWARDSLAWVEIAAESHMRENDGVMVRSQTPKVEHELRVDAMNIVRYLSEQNHPEALFMRGKWMEFGKFGVRAEKKEAYQMYKRAADQGWGRAEYRIGMLFENSNDIANAITHYEEGARMKDSAAQYRLGMMHLLGQHGYPKNFQRGLELINNAADSADEDAPQGAYVFGMLIARELPDINVADNLLPYNLNTARQYIEKAAYLGFAKAQLKMGQAYELAQLGVDFNPSYSLHYYALAARQGQPEAALGVSRWFLFGYDTFFAKNEQLAFKYAKQAADAKLGTGEFAMGYYYEIGIHVDKNLRTARSWYEKAADHDNKDAIARLESLNQQKTLSKQDHETTALARIKSQHGSQRGKRPDRFKQRDTMPTLSESAPDAETTSAPVPPVKNSPQPSPRHQPTIVEEHVDFPDPSPTSRPPAFTINIDHGNLAHRPKSTAPYPEDDRPPPLTLTRPKSAAPYPDDDMVGSKPPLSPHYNPQIRPSARTGPHADRPGSAFGIRPVSPSGRPGSGPGLPSSQSLAALPSQQAQRGRLPSAGWEPQVPSSYRQPSPGPGRGGEYPPYRQDSPQRHPPFDPGPRQPVGAAPGPGAGINSGPVGDPTRNRLTKNNPKPNPAPGQFPMPGYGPQSPPANIPPTMSGAQPGRDYGPRTSSRPASDVYDRYGAVPSAGARPGPTNPGGRPERVDSLPVNPAIANHARIPSGGPRPGVPLKDDHHGRSSAPPSQGARPGIVSPPLTSPPPPASAGGGRPAGPRPAAAAAAAHPDGKTMGQGPATFEEMGIPQGKGDDQCSVM